VKIELRSAPHRKIAVADILPNPHRDLELNPTSPERIGQLLESFERTGFWDNIVVREHPTRDSKYQLAYGHNRLAALKTNGVTADTVTIPVAKLSDWEMYCAMVDENEMQGAITTAIAIENIGKGCDLIEKALKKIGKDGTWEEFNEAVGRVVPVGTTVRDKHDGGFEQVRNAFFENEGLGRRFLSEFLPCGKMRAATITTVINERYAADREKAKRAEAARKAAEAKEKERRAQEEEDAEERKRLEDEAAAERAEAEKLEAAADKIGKGHIAKNILLMFDAPRTMSDFASAIRRLGIDKKHHAAAAKHVINAKVKEERIERELAIWWDDVSGASSARRKKAKAEEEQEKFRKAAKGIDPVDYLLKIADDLKNIEPRIKTVLQHIHAFGPRERKVIRGKIADFTSLLNTLVERERETFSGTKDITPAKKMLSHQKGR